MADDGGWMILVSDGEYSERGLPRSSDHGDSSDLESGSADRGVFSVTGTIGPIYLPGPGQVSSN